VFLHLLLCYLRLVKSKQPVPCLSPSSVVGSQLQSNSSRLLGRKKNTRTHTHTSTYTHCVHTPTHRSRNYVESPTNARCRIGTVTYALHAPHTHTHTHTHTYTPTTRPPHAQRDRSSSNAKTRCAKVQTVATALSRDFRLSHIPAGFFIPVVPHFRLLPPPTIPSQEAVFESVFGSIVHILRRTRASGAPRQQSLVLQSSSPPGECAHPRP
jgi:hypothetical protein